jgi:hypothetical protein
VLTTRGIGQAAINLYKPNLNHVHEHRLQWLFLTLCKYMYKECIKELEERCHTSVYLGYLKRGKTTVSPRFF